MDCAEFHDLLAALRFIDLPDLPGFDPILWRKFRDDPVRFFVACDDASRALIWQALVTKRGKLLPCRMTIAPN